MTAIDTHDRSENRSGNNAPATQEVAKNDVSLDVVMIEAKAGDMSHLPPVQEFDEDENRAVIDPANLSLTGERLAGLYAASKAANSEEAREMAQTLLASMDTDEAVHTIGAVMNEYKKIRGARMILFAVAAFGMGVVVSSKLMNGKDQQAGKPKTEQVLRPSMP